jgi:UDP-N-acetylmuramate--alanine ligase
MNPILGKTERIHFIGIGGIGMSGLALVLRNLNFKISGSDINRSDITANLVRQGIKVFFKHRRENIAGADVVVFSTAIRQDNPEIAEAKRLGTPIIHRSELLAELTRIKTSVCISGTHGKTTTSSMVSEVLQRGGLSPTAMIGGVVKGKSQAKVGRGRFLVCEADESDKSFLRLLPSYAVITNIEPEHLEYYKNIDEIKENFTYFANHVPFWGAVFLCSDSPGNLEIKENILRKVVLYGLNEHAVLKAGDIRRSNFGSTFSVTYAGRQVGAFGINLPGIHNVTNSLAAIGVGLELSVPVARIRLALKQFKGVHRRMEYRGRADSVRIFEDYGHHPTEIAVTLQTMREYFPDRRIISVFQPHRYTRTYHLFDQFALSFMYANIVVVTEIYPAHELPIPGVTGEALTKRIRKEQDNVFFQKNFDAITNFLKKTCRPNDIILVQGAGNINRIVERLLKELR